MQDTGLQSGDEGAYRGGCGELWEQHLAAPGSFSRIITRGGKHIDIKVHPSLLPSVLCLAVFFCSDAPTSCHFPESFTFIFISRSHFPAPSSPAGPLACYPRLQEGHAAAFPSAHTRRGVLRCPRTADSPQRHPLLLPPFSLSLGTAQPPKFPGKQLAP